MRIVGLRVPNSRSTGRHQDWLKRWSDLYRLEQSTVGRWGARVGFGACGCKLIARNLQAR